MLSDYFRTGRFALSFIGRPKKEKKLPLEMSRIGGRGGIIKTQSIINAKLHIFYVKRNPKYPSR